MVIADTQEADGLKVIDLGAGHASSGETLGGRIVVALKTEGYLNESVGAGYLDRSWPEALKEPGAWPLASLRKCFLDGSFTRLLDPDAVLRTRIVEFVTKGEFGLASGAKPDGAYQRVWFNEPVGAEEVSFEYNVFLLRKDRARALKPAPKPEPPKPIKQPVQPTGVTGGETETGGGPAPIPDTPPAPLVVTLKISGAVPPESWNRFGSKLIPKVRAGQKVQVKVELSCRLDSAAAGSTEADIRQVLEDLGLSASVRVDKET